MLLKLKRIVINTNKINYIEVRDKIRNHQFLDIYLDNGKLMLDKDDSKIMNDYIDNNH